MLTGYEQVRSVISAVAGDWEAARRVELVLPETGVCSIDGNDAGGGSCCGSAAGDGRMKKWINSQLPIPNSQSNRLARPG
jgi:hypothetical protein